MIIIIKFNRLGITQLNWNRKESYNKHEEKNKYEIKQKKVSFIFVGSYYLTYSVETIK